VLKPTGKRAIKLLVALEVGIDALRPELSQQVTEYALQHDINLVEVLILEGGEAIKHSFAGVQQILEAINRWDIDRHSYFMAIGGGAFLDATGFAAATAHRGVRSIRVPTTVLAQNDSGVGVKNAINYFGKKILARQLLAAIRRAQRQRFPCAACRSASGAPGWRKRSRSR
jgi:3-dehydroquinate synthase